jgi:hypothetical protein
MPVSNLVRIGGGLASTAAGILLLLGHLLDLGGDSDYGAVLGGALVLTAHVVLVFALMGLYAAQAQQSGVLGSLGMVLGVVGTTLVCGVVLVEIAGASGAEVDAVLGAGLPGALALLGGLAFLIGLILFGVATMGGSASNYWGRGVRGGKLCGGGCHDLLRDHRRVDHLLGACVAGLVATL